MKWRPVGGEGSLPKGTLAPFLQREGALGLVIMGSG